MAYRRDGEYFSEKGSMVKDIDSKCFYIQSKKFYIDVKENQRGKFLKMSEVAPNGQKMRIVMDMATGGEFQDRLTEFIEAFMNLSDEKPNANTDNYGSLKSETIMRENRRYYLDLKENFRGRFLKVSMTLPTHERCQIVIPAQGMVDVRDALIEILSKHGREDTSRNLHKNKENSLHVENKTFFFDIGNNDRGSFLRISEVCGAFRTMITVPEAVWEQFISTVDEATLPCDADVKPPSPMPVDS